MFGDHLNRDLLLYNFLIPMEIQDIVNNHEMNVHRDHLNKLTNHNLILFLVAIVMSYFQMMLNQFERMIEQILNHKMLNRWIH